MLEAVDRCFSALRARHPDVAEHAGEEAFLAGSIDEAARRESRRVQGAEAGPADNQGEDEGAKRAEDDGTEFDGDGVRGDDDGLGEYEDICDACCDVDGHD